MQQPKRIYQYDIRGRFVAEHGSIIGAAASLRKAAPNISSVLRGLSRTAYGYQWSYTKLERMEPVQGKQACHTSLETLAKNLHRELPFTDHGVITEPTHREFGKRKIVIGNMEVYAKPERDVAQLVEKYSRINFY